MNNQAVLYFRVSTIRQGESGLGLEAQQFSVKNYLNNKPFTVIKQFIEVQSSNRKKNKERPKFRDAVQLCKETGATLIAAKLDRLERSVKATTELLDSGVEFLCVDNPNINRFTMQILACVAEKELQDISDRTKGALQELKKQGKQLGSAGSDNLDLPQTFEGAAYHRAQTHAKAVNFAKFIYPTIAHLKQTGLPNYKISEELNKRKHPSPSGAIGKWTPTTVGRCLKRVQL